MLHQILVYLKLQAIRADSYFPWECIIYFAVGTALMLPFCRENIHIGRKKRNVHIVPTRGGYAYNW